MRNSPARAVLFDLDDTLFDHRHGNIHALSRLRELHPTFRAVEAGILEQRYNELLNHLFPRVLAGEITIQESRRIRFHRLLEEYGGREAARDAVSVATEYIRHYRESWRPVAGAPQLLEVLRTRARIGVVTNGVVSEQREKIRVCDFGLVLDEVVISEEAGVGKPDPAIFHLAMDRLGAKGEETVMVGNSWEDDIVGARAAGLGAIWLNRTGKPCPDPGLAREIGALVPVGRVADIILKGGCE